MERIALVRLPLTVDVGTPHPRNIVIPFAVGFIASMAHEQGRKVLILDLVAEGLTLEEVAERLEDFGPDLVAIDCPTAAVHRAIEIFRRARNLGVRFTLAMGQHASVMPETYLIETDVVDACLVGEPELTFMDLLRCLDAKGDLHDVAGLALRSPSGDRAVPTKPRPLLRDLDRLPPIKYDLFPIDRYDIRSTCVPVFGRVRWGFLLTSRGCPHECVFCSPVGRRSYGRRFRANSPKRVVDDMECLVRQYRVNAISMEDDVFTLDRNRVIQICDEIIRRRLKIHWVAQVRSDTLDRALLRSMRTAGCSGINMGVESGSDRIREILGKGLSTNVIRRAVKESKDEGMTLTLSFIIGNPTETYDELMQTLDFALELAPNMIQVHYMTPYPGSRLFEMFAKDIQFLKGLGQHDHFSYNLSDCSNEELAAFRKKFYRRFYLSPRTIWSYLTGRAPYTIFDPRELALFRRTWAFMWKGAVQTTSGRKEARSLPLGKGAEFE